MQINHFEFLLKYQEEILEKLYDESDTLLGAFKENFSVFIQTRILMFFAEFRLLNEYLVNLLKIIDAGENYYIELNNEIELWLTSFFKIFFKEFELTMSKDSDSTDFEKSNQFFYF